MGKVLSGTEKTTIDVNERKRLRFSRLYTFKSDQNVFIKHKIKRACNQITSV